MLNLAYLVRAIPARKVLPAAIAALALAFGATAASAQKWVEYDITGAGTWSMLDQSGYPDVWTNGHASLSARFFVELDPGSNDDWDASWWSDGNQYTLDLCCEDGSHFEADAGPGTLAFLKSQPCDSHDGCENYTINLNFAPGGSANLPAKRGHLLGGSFDYQGAGFYTTMTADGSALSFTTKLVDTAGSNRVFIRQDTAVPEPASWAMMVAGFGVIGGALRYRRKAVVSAG